jgi:hypothetical protein
VKSNIIVFPKLNTKVHSLLFKRLTDAPTVHLQSCGHVVHFDCLEGYLSSRSNSNPEDKMMDLKSKEFWCPVCRRLSNVLIPLISLHGQSEKSSSLMRSSGCMDVEMASPYVKETEKKDEKSTPSNEVDNCVDWLSRSLWDVSRLLKRSGKWGGILFGENGGIRTLLNRFYQQIHLIHYRKKKKGLPQSGVKVFTTLLNCVTSTLMAVEIHGRQKNSENAEIIRIYQSSQFATLRTYTESLLCSIRCGLHDDPLFGPSAPILLMTTINLFLTGSCEMGSPQKGGGGGGGDGYGRSRELLSRTAKPSEARPLMVLDVFNLFVRWVLTSQDLSLTDAFYSILKICYIAVITQAILYVTITRSPFGQTQLQESQPSEPSTPTLSVSSIYDFIKGLFPCRGVPKLEGMVEALCLPFLRNAFLFLNFCVSPNPDSIGSPLLDTHHTIHIQFESLRKGLFLPPLNALIVGHTVPQQSELHPTSVFSHHSICQLVGRWVLRFREGCANLEIHKKPFWSFMSPFRRFELIPLPTLFQVFPHLSSKFLFFLHTTLLAVLFHSDEIFIFSLLFFSFFFYSFSLFFSSSFSSLFFLIFFLFFFPSIFSFFSFFFISRICSTAT